MKAFAGNKGIRFADICLTDVPIRGPPHNPGAGGWPTIRYFNAETGVDGGSYVKKTDDPICTELGNEDYMIEYVEEAGKTMLCDVITGANCDEKSAAFIEKMKVKSADEQQAYIDRLVGMEGNDMKDDLKRWLKTRKQILKNLLKVGDGDGASAEL